MTIVKRILVNTAVNWLSKILMMLIAMFTVPLLLSSLGKYDYGLWVTIGQTIGFFTLMDFGIGSSVCRLVSAVDEKDYLWQNQIVSTAFAVFLISAIFALCIIVIATFFISDVLNVSAEKRTITKIIFFIMSVKVTISFPLRLGRGLIQAKHRYDYIDLSILICQISIFLSLILLFKVKLISLGSVCFITVFFTLLLECLLFLKARSIYQNIQFGLSYINKQTFKTIFSFSSSAFLQTLSGMLSVQGMIFICGIALGVESVPNFSIPCVFLMSIGPFIGRTGTTFMPIASRYDAEGKKHEIITLSRNGVKYSMLVGLIIGLFLLCMGKQMIGLWLGHATLDSDDIHKIYAALIVMSLPMILARSNMGNRAILRATGDHWKVSNILIAASITGILIGLALMKFSSLGILGAAVGWSFKPLFAETFCFSCFVIKKYKMNLLSYIKTCYLMPILSVLPIYLIFRSVHVYIKANNDLLSFVINTVVFFTISIICCFFIGVDRLHKRKILLKLTEFCNQNFFKSIRIKYFQ